MLHIERELRYFNKQVATGIREVISQNFNLISNRFRNI